MNLTSLFKWSVAAVAGVAGLAHSQSASALAEYGGSYKCTDDAVKGQVVRALSSASVPYQSNAIAASKSKMVFDGSAVQLTVGSATSIVSQPGASGEDSSLRIKRAKAGTPVDVLACAYRKPASKSWSSVGVGDLKPMGRLAKRMEGAAAKLGKNFASSDAEGISEDLVIVLVAQAVDKGKEAGFEVSVASEKIARKAKKAPPAQGGGNAGVRVIKEASDPSWKQYKYGQQVDFPEAEGKVWGWDDKAFDCSYYTWLVYRRAGLEYTFTGTEGLAQVDNPDFVRVTKPQAGDLVVWRPEISGGSIHHVGIVIDDQTFWDNSGSSSVGISKFSWSAYDKPRIYLRRKGL
jgi:cell wall-associated NlpC family hydrolase